MEILDSSSIDTLRRWCLERGRSNDTIRAYTGDMRSFLRESGLTSVPLDQFPSEAAKWLISKRMILAPTTTRRRLASVREMGKCLGCGDILKDIKLPVPAEPQPHPLPGGIVDLRALVAVATTDRKRALIGMLGYEGMRIAEALYLRPCDVDMTNRILKVHGKGFKVRNIPFTRKAQELILPLYLDRIFTDPNAPMIEYSERHARLLITEMGVAARISRPIASHDLRATFATLAYAKTRDAKAVQAWLGHASADTTAVYIDVPMDTLRVVGEIE